MRIFSFLLAAFAAVVLAVPVPPQNASLLPPFTFPKGKKTKEPKNKDTLPILELPYGSFQATEERRNVYTFKNIPYAAPPTGDLRWKKPQLPLNFTGVQDGARHEPGCCEVEMDGFKFEEDDKKGSLMDDMFCSNRFYFDTDVESEDCLFLDITVPKEAFDGDRELPVVVFIYGGGFVDGRKEGSKMLFALYDGYGLVKESEENVIFVTFNYRVGAFGFLGGKSFEEQGGVPNVGLWDQRAVFQWVQDHISKVGGDPKQVTAMGHSAGAASIMYHLTAEGGTLDPMFQRAILLSPANQPMWDRNGTIDKRFKDFEEVAYCEGKGLECLRKANTHHLQGANRAVARAQLEGNFAWGPHVDGSFVKNLPVNELEAGNFWPLDALMMSYVHEETKKFWPMWIKNNDDFERYVKSTIPQSLVDLEAISQIREMYPDIIKNQLVLKGKPFYRDQETRVREMIRDSCITCNIRWMLEAYGVEKSWLMHYNVSPADHGKDLSMTFFYGKPDPDNIEEWGHSVINALPQAVMRGYHKNYKSYVSSFIRSGDPNLHRRHQAAAIPNPPTISWPHPKINKGEGFIRQILHFEGNPFRYFFIKPGYQMPQEKCDFWKSFYQEAIAFYEEGTPIKNWSKAKFNTDAAVLRITAATKRSSTTTEKTTHASALSAIPAPSKSSNVTESRSKTTDTSVLNTTTAIVELSRTTNAVSETAGASDLSTTATISLQRESRPEQTTTISATISGSSGTTEFNSKAADASLSSTTAGSNANILARGLTGAFVTSKPLIMARPSFKTEPPLGLHNPVATKGPFNAAVPYPKPGPPRRLNKYKDITGSTKDMESTSEPVQDPAWYFFLDGVPAEFFKEFVKKHIPNLNRPKNSNPAKRKGRTYRLLGWVLEAAGMAFENLISPKAANGPSHSAEPHATVHPAFVVNNHSIAISEAVNYRLQTSGPSGYLTTPAITKTASKKYKYTTMTTTTAKYPSRANKISDYATTTTTTITMTGRSTPSGLPKINHDDLAPRDDMISKRSPVDDDPYFKTVAASIRFNDTVTKASSNAAHKEPRNHGLWSLSPQTCAILIFVLWVGFFGLL